MPQGNCSLTAASPWLVVDNEVTVPNQSFIRPPLTACRMARVRSLLSADSFNSFSWLFIATPYFTAAVVTAEQNSLSDCGISGFHPATPAVPDRASWAQPAPAATLHF